MIIDLFYNTSKNTKYITNTFMTNARYQTEISSSKNESIIRTSSIFNRYKKFYHGFEQQRKPT